MKVCVLPATLPDCSPGVRLSLNPEFPEDQGVCRTILTHCRDSVAGVGYHHETSEVTHLEIWINK